MCAVPQHAPGLALQSRVDCCIIAGCILGIDVVVVVGVCFATVTGTVCLIVGIGNGNDGIVTLLGIFGPGFGTGGGGMRF